jgi:signal transduction histidine kinase
MDRTKQTSFGLLGMRERALALGGHVEINSTPGQGTIISMTAPLSLVDDKEFVA